MTTTNTSLPATTTLTEVEKVKIGTEIAKAGYNYEKLLQEVSNLVVTKENVGEVQQKLKSFRNFVGIIDKVENPYKKGWQAHNDAKKSLVDPAQKVLDEKTKQVSAISISIQQERDRQDKELKRQQQIKTDIDVFILQSSSKIAAATTDGELLIIERQINLEKTRTSKYDSQHSILVERCNGLNELVKKQKEAIRLREKLDKELSQPATDEEILSLYGRKEELDEEINSRSIEVQEQALKSTESSIETVVPEIVATAPKPRRTQLKYELTDATKAFKRIDLLDVSINATKMREEIQQLKDSGDFTDDMDEFFLPGIRIYKEKLY